MFRIFARAYSLGGGTFTGIEAVSNGVAVLREPKVETGKKTMAYMGTSLALTASGILLCYMLLHIQPVEGKTLNAVLADRFAGAFRLGTLPVGAWFVMLTVFSEAILLLVAAQTGFIDGPRVMANMAADSWLPRRFAALSDRMTMQNGILLIGLSAMALLAYTRGNINVIVIMYSMNVFLTFSLSETGMVRFWIKHRETEPLWKRNLSIHSTGLVLCITILAVMVKEKFTEGAWMTMVITSCCIALCFLIKAHYNKVAREILEVKKVFSRLTGMMQRDDAVAIASLSPAHTAAILVGAYDGVGMHLFLNVLRLFPNYFKNVVFISIGKVDSDFFRRDKHVEALEIQTRKNLDKYVELSDRAGIPASSVYALGTDVVLEASNLCLQIGKEFPHTIFFAGELLFEKPAWYHRFLHNETSYAIQREIRFAGLSMLILPLLLQNKRSKQMPVPVEATV
ncbi:APC family permease [Candidatus Sumerlaeota bacterium]|nr:APC family permease [Candidatus Sumerlaeota bacterium]